MSSIKLAPNASGTGEFTIAAPNSNTNRTFNLPDSSGTIATAESTLSQFNASGSAPVYACRAWVNFNGTGTVAIRASGNVTSITDNAAGNFTVNFTTAMPDTNYSVLGWARSDTTANTVFGYVSAPSNGSKTTSAIQIFQGVQNSGTTFPSADATEVNVAIFR